MTSTVAPWAMADCAMLTWVASLPSAFCTVNSDDGSPAAANAAFRYGASKSIHRLDDVVSGMMTATLPLPSGASGASGFSALNEGSMSLTVSDGAPAFALAGADVPAALAGAEAELVLELQAAISSAALRPAAVRPALFIRPALSVREDTNVPRFSLSRAWEPRGEPGLPGERICAPGHRDQQALGGIVRSVKPGRPST